MDKKKTRKGGRKVKMVGKGRTGRRPGYYAAVAVLGVTGILLVVSLGLETYHLYEAGGWRSALTIPTIVAVLLALPAAVYLVNEGGTGG